jgi:hypothetical protein
VFARLKNLDLFFHAAIVLMAVKGVKADEVPGRVCGELFYPSTFF